MRVESMRSKSVGSTILARSLLRPASWSTHGMTAIGVMIDDLCLAIEDCGDVELYDDPEDPLGRAARMVDELRLIIDGGRRFAEGGRQTTPPVPALALELREGADGCPRSRRS